MSRSTNSPSTGVASWAGVKSAGGPTTNPPAARASSPLGPAASCLAYRRPQLCGDFHPEVLLAG